MSENNTLININVQICDRPYRLKVKPTEEEVVRKAAKNISDKVKELQEQFAGKDKQDYLAMCALTLSVENQAVQSNHQHVDSEILNDIARMDAMLTKALD
ncbi:MAG TPA: cell division protein ZapA [Chitinophagales bacterium]|nr:cell division protein ZapA [Chitinophagales bacterium]